MTLAEKVVVITGGTFGIGRAVAGACAARGARVVICGRCETDVERAAAELSAGGGAPVTGHAVDVTDYAAVEALRDGALAAHGRIDVWFNNAGMPLGYRPVDEIDAAELERIVAVNLTGHLFGCRAILPYFREHGGYLMNMAGRGYRGEATPHTAAYAATKTAIASLTRSLAAENRDVSRLSINALVPGMVLTRFYDDIPTSPRLEATKENWRYAMDAFGVPIDEVAEKTAAWLGEEPGARTGQVLSLLGLGRTARGILRLIGYRMTGKLVKD